MDAVDIAEVAKIFHDVWNQQTTRHTSENATLLKKYGINYIGDYDELGYAFTINGVAYSSSWNVEVVRDDEPRRSFCWERDLNVPPLTNDDVAALDFAEAFHDLITSCFDAVHIAANHIGWYWVGDDETEGTYCHYDTGRYISVQHWFGDVNLIDLVLMAMGEYDS